MPSHLQKLGPESADEVRSFCARHPAASTVIAGWIEEGGLAGHKLAPKASLWAERGPRNDISGVVYMSQGGVVMPIATRASTNRELADRGLDNPASVRVLVGERELVGEIWNHLSAAGAVARLDRNQLEFAVEAADFVPAPAELRLVVADMGDLEGLVATSAAMAREEAQDDPYGRNPELFRSRIRERIARGRDLVHRDGGHLLFKANVAAISDVGGQVEGIYTHPEHRNRGLGHRGTSAVTAWVLARSPRAVLLVNEDNEPAKRLYRRLGYKQTQESRTIFISP